MTMHFTCPRIQNMCRSYGEALLIFQLKPLNPIVFAFKLFSTTFHNTPLTFKFMVLFIKSFCSTCQDKLLAVKIIGKKRKDDRI